MAEVLKGPGLTLRGCKVSDQDECRGFDGRGAVAAAADGEADSGECGFAAKTGCS